MYQISCHNDAHLSSTYIWNASFCDNESDPWFGRVHLGDPIAKFYPIQEERLIARFNGDEDSSDEEFDVEFSSEEEVENKEEQASVDWGAFLKKTTKFKSRHFKGIEHFPSS